MNIKKTSSNAMRWTLCSAILLGMSVPLCSAKAAAGGVPKGEHGAATMEYQAQMLSKLLPAADVSRVPRGFDPVVWLAFIPQDNALTAQRVELGRKLYFEKRL